MIIIVLFSGWPVFLLAYIILPRRLNVKLARGVLILVHPKYMVKSSSQFYQIRQPQEVAKGRTKVLLKYQLGAKLSSTGFSRHFEMLADLAAIFTPKKVSGTDPGSNLVENFQV